MKEGRLNLRLDQSLLADARDYAMRHGYTITQLIEDHLRQILAEERIRNEKRRFDTEQIDA